MTEKQIIVTLKQGADIEKVASRLESNGMVVQSSLAAIGMITGKANANIFTKLQADPDVKALEEDAPVSSTS